MILPRFINGVGTTSKEVADSIIQQLPKITLEDWEFLRQEELILHQDRLIKWNEIVAEETNKPFDSFELYHKTTSYERLIYPTKRILMPYCLDDYYPDKLRQGTLSVCTPSGRLDGVAIYNIETADFSGAYYLLNLTTPHPKESQLDYLTSLSVIMIPREIYSLLEDYQKEIIGQFLDSVGHDIIHACVTTTIHKTMNRKFKYKFFNHVLPIRVNHPAVPTGESYALNTFIQTIPRPEYFEETKTKFMDSLKVASDVYFKASHLPKLERESCYIWLATFLKRQATAVFPVEKIEEMTKQLNEPVIEYTWNRTENTGGSGKRVFYQDKLIFGEQTLLLSEITQVYSEVLEKQMNEFPVYARPTIESDSSSLNSILALSCMDLYYNYFWNNTSGLIWRLTQASTITWDESFKYEIGTVIFKIRSLLRGLARIALEGSPEYSSKEYRAGVNYVEYMSDHKTINDYDTAVNSLLDLIRRLIPQSEFITEKDLDEVKNFHSLLSKKNISSNTLRTDTVEL
jgi:hypothetical protein